MHSAIYYPFRQITDPGFLASGLLLWDQIECVINAAGDPPPINFNGRELSHPTMRPYLTDDSLRRLMHEGCELLVKNAAPSAEALTAVHNQALELASRDLPEEFAWDAAYVRDREMHFPEDLFLPATMAELHRANLVELNQVTYTHRHGLTEERWEWVASKSFGYILMSMLAEACAGTAKRTITTEPDAYAGLGQFLMQLHAGQPAVPGSAEMLVSVAVPSFAESALDLKRLVTLRKAEHNGDYFLRELRHRYMAASTEYALDIMQPSRTASDRRELSRVFNQRMSDHLQELKRRLRVSSLEVLLSKPMMVAMLATAGMMVEPVSGSLITIGSLVNTAVSYREARRKLLRESPMAWLYHVC